MEGRIKVMGIRKGRCKQLLDELKETRKYCKLKGEALARTMWKTHFGFGHGPVVRLRSE
jgi:hypothetical protein